MDIKLTGGTVGVISRGIRAPIIREGDDIIEIVVNSVLNSCDAENFSLNDRDVIGVTESAVARSQGNYVSVDQIAEEAQSKLGKNFVIVHPILSRNRFSLILKGLARGADHLMLVLSYPRDEVGNPLMNEDKMYDLGINKSTEILGEAQYRSLFTRPEEVQNPFTGVDCVLLYREIMESEGTQASIFLANDPRAALHRTKNILAADIHSRERTKQLLRKAGAKVVVGLDDFCTEARDGKGYNSTYGLLGSNIAGEERLKLFPRDGQTYVDAIQQRIYELTGRNVHVMIYGDGAFRCPQSQIWEFADPVVSPAYTIRLEEEGLNGRPDEIKFKHYADTLIRDLSGPEAEKAMKRLIEDKGENGKDSSLVGKMASQGTTPRNMIDLLGSLCDLTSGSGDKGTPIVLIQNYFHNFSDNY